MAWLDCERTGIFQLGFTFGGRRFKRSLRTRDERVAEATLHRVEESIRLVETGRLSVPANADLATFLISDGKIASTPDLPEPISLGTLFNRYRKRLAGSSTAGDLTTTTAGPIVHWITRPPPRMRLAVFFQLRLRLSLQNTAELLNPDSPT